MTALSDFIQVIRTWIDEDEETFPDSVGEACVRMAEDRINNELRHIDLMKRATVTLTDQCVNLPTVWQEMIYVRYPGGLPLTFLTPDEYWRTRAAGKYPPTLGITNATEGTDPLSVSGGVLTIEHVESNRGGPPTMRLAYTIIGRTLFLHPNVNSDDGTEIEICYYGDVEPLGDNPTTFFTKHYKLYLMATLAGTAPWLQEDDRLGQWNAEATAQIQSLQAASVQASISGSPIRMRVRGFG